VGISRALAFKTNSSKTLLCGIPVGFTKEFQGEINVLKGGQGGEEIKKLKDKSEAPTSQVGSPFLAEALKVMAFHFDEAFCGPVKPGNKIKECCFTRSALTEKGNDFPRQYLEVCPPEGNTVLPFIAILFPEVYDANNWCHLGTLPFGSSILLVNSFYLNV
jgi:hypothetical protein